MTFFGQKFTPPMRLVFFHSMLIALEGTGVLISLLIEPSQGGGFLGFSLGRWAILFVNLLILAGACYATYRVWSNQTGNLETWLSNQRNLFKLFFLSLVVFSVSLPAALGAIPAIRYFAYFGRIRPSLIWLVLASGQIFLTLVVWLRSPILAWFEQFFPLDERQQNELSLTKVQSYVMLGFTLVYLALQWGSHLQVKEARWLPDSIDYIFPAETFAWNELGLWTHTKPWGAAILYKLTGTFPVTIDVVQTVFSAFAWLSLAWVFSRFIRTRWLKLTTFAFILGFSLVPSVQMWNHIIQSEALSISLMVLILAVWMSLLQNWRWDKLLALILLFAWWIGTRETNVYLSLMTAGILAVVGLFYKRQRFYWGVSIALIVFCVINMQISEIPTIPRWLYPLTNTLLNRILPNEEYLTFFEDRGLPVPPELLSLRGGLANSGDFAVFNDPALNDVESWLYRKGKDVYVQFLLRHPVYTLTDPWKHVDLLLAPKDLSTYAPEGYRPIQGWVTGTFLFPDSLWLLLLLIGLSTFATIVAATWRNSSIFWLLCFALILFVPHFYLVWHGDAAEVSRHAIQASVQLRLTLWLLLLLALDKIVKNGYSIRTRHRS